MLEASLFGLVLAGGLSRRMGEDKAGLDYFGMPQWRWCHEALSRVCEKVFVSCRKEQIAELGIDVPVLTDPEECRGPATGLKLAHKIHPAVSWLVFPVDMPFLEEEHIDLLIKNRNPKALLTAFEDPISQKCDPLFAIWEPEGLKRLGEKPIAVALSNEAHRVRINLAELSSVNTPEEKEKFISQKQPGFK